MLTLEQRIYLVKCYGLGNVSYNYAIHLFNERYPNVAVSRPALKKLINKFDQTGSVANKKKVCKKYDDDDAVTIMALESVAENPRKSLRTRASELNVSHALLQTIYKVNKVYPFKPKFRHTLEIEDHAVRLDFCLWIGENIMDNRYFYQNLMFSDEATFSTNGTVSSQNCRYWSTQNPNFNINARNQRYRKVNVWCGMLYNRIVGPYFFNENLNQHNYLEMLQNFLLPSLEQEELGHIYFQQDGCPAHSTLQVREWLNLHFPDKWIGRFGPIHWPARSPDLTPMDFFLWGFLKQKVYKERLDNDLDSLRMRITQAVNDINVEMLHNVYNNFRRRAEECVNQGGQYIE